MKSFTAQVYNRRLEREVEATVYWSLNLFTNESDIHSIDYRGEDIKSFVPIHQRVNVMCECDKLARLLNHEQRTKMFNPEL